MKVKKRLSTKQEEYLESILRLIREKGSARVRDIARDLSVHKSTVTAALKKLADKGLIKYSPYEIATLSDDGVALGEELERKHGVIEDFLAKVLIIPKEVARENACRMEHVMDKEVLARLTAFAEFVETHPMGNQKWPEHFAAHLKESERGER